MATGFGALFNDLRALAAIETNAAMEQEMERLVETVEADAQARYGVYGANWPQLSPVTQAERAAAGFPANEPRLRTGAERAAVTHSVERGATEIVGYVGIKQGDPSAPGALANEFGTLTAHPIPPRPILAPAAAAHEGDFLDGVEAAITTSLRP